MTDSKRPDSRASDFSGSRFDWLLQRWSSAGHRVAIVWHGESYTYNDLLHLRQRCLDRIRRQIEPGTCTALIGDFSPMAIANLAALIQHRCVVVPLLRSGQARQSDLYRIAHVEASISISTKDESSITRVPGEQTHHLIERIRDAGESGLVLFSSGSSGVPRAALHSLDRWLGRYRKPVHSYITLCFLLFDHIGGINTLLHTLTNLGCVVIPENRHVDTVARIIEEHRVELLPTSPSFLNLMLLGESHIKYDLSSLKKITYGSEVMREATLSRTIEAFPRVKLKQTYGLTEMGILSSRTDTNQSLFITMDGQDCETRLIDGCLYVRSARSMLGYLNAPDPFDRDGWFNTGDLVHQSHNGYRILGRKSDIINCGGLKVHADEVENIIAEMPGVIDVVVSGKEHALLGQTVFATIQSDENISAIEMKNRIRAFARNRLEPFMIPSKVKVVNRALTTDRFKRARG